MASLQRIRNHGALLIAIVGLAMLAFILGDFLNSGSSFFNRSRENVGVIEGQKVHYTEYEAAKEQLTEVYKIETGRSDFDEDMHAQIRNQVWNMFVMDYTMRAQAKKIGMDITADELTELCVGENVHQILRGRRAFYGEDGQYSREIVKNLIAAINEGSEDGEQNANLQQAKTYWMYWEKAVRMSYMQEKYTSVLQHLLMANSLDAEYAFDARQKGVSAEYVMQPYFTVADSLVKVSDRDIKKLKLDARSAEIQRLIGRSLRAAVDTSKIDGLQITIDCDVLQADGGTRCASITGGMLALEDAVRKLLADGVISESPIAHRVAAVSVGVCDGKPTLDLDYAHDSTAEVDLNVVMTDDGRYVELQGTAEHNPFTEESLDALRALARKGLRKIFKLMGT